MGARKFLDGSEHERERYAVILGAVLRHLRERRDMSGREFARMMRLSQGYMSQVERGESSPPTLDNIEKMAALLGASDEELAMLLVLSGRIGDRWWRDLAGDIDSDIRVKLNYEQINTWSGSSDGRELLYGECMAVCRRHAQLLTPKTIGGVVSMSKSVDGPSRLSPARRRLLDAVSGLDEKQIDTLAGMAESFAHTTKDGGDHPKRESPRR